MFRDRTNLITLEPIPRVSSPPLHQESEADRNFLYSGLNSPVHRNQRCDVHIYDEVLVNPERPLEDAEGVAEVYSWHIALAAPVRLNERPPIANGQRSSLDVSTDLSGQLSKRLKVGMLC
jgi:hypothetical protein